jgi:hypothetical protein
MHTRKVRRRQKRKDEKKNFEFRRKELKKRSFVLKNEFIRISNLMEMIFIRITLVFFSRVIICLGVRVIITLIRTIPPLIMQNFPFIIYLFQHFHSQSLLCCCFVFFLFPVPRVEVGDMEKLWLNLREDEKPPRTPTNHHLSTPRRQLKSPSCTYFRSIRRDMFAGTQPSR